MFPTDPIPGQTPLDDLSGLRIKSIRTQAQLNEAEAANILKAVTKYLAAKPSPRSATFDVRWMKRLHKEMFGDVWQWAGTFRTADTNIGQPWRQIETSMHALQDDLRAWQSGVPLGEQAVLLHHRSVSIHPFKNGNGRWARLLANIWLKLHGADVITWPESTIGAASTIRAEYLAAIRAADNFDYVPLVELHRRYSPSET
jgi:Fic-DOC domain mobile mystery protein B